MRPQKMIQHLHIGQRMVKTAVAVFMCFVIDYFRTSGNPFHSAIAAIVSLQKSMEESWDVGRQRVAATIIGGTFGTLVVAFEQNIYLIPHELLRYLVLSLMLIPLIKLTVLLKQPRGVSITCVVFLAITINAPITSGMDAAMTYALNRILDTLIGVLMSLIVNMVPFTFWRKFSQNQEIND